MVTFFFASASLHRFGSGSMASGLCIISCKNGDTNSFNMTNPLILQYADNNVVPGVLSLKSVVLVAILYF